MTSVDVIKYSEYPPSSTNDTIKQDQLFEEFTILIETIKNIRDKKIKDSVKIYKIAVDHAYEIDDPILIRRFLLKTVQEINDDLIENTKPYRIDFVDDMLNHFVGENESYLKKKKKKEFYDDYGTLHNFKLEDCLETLDKIVRSCSFSNKLFLNPKEIETDLIVSYL